MSDKELSKKKDHDEPFSASKEQSIGSSTKSTNISVSNLNQSQSKHSQQNFDNEITEKEKVTQAKIVNKANDNSNNEFIVSKHEKISSFDENN